MMKKDKILGLLLVVLMLTGASITVNKAVFGHSFVTETEPLTAKSDDEAITLTPDGSTVIHTAGMEGVISGYGGAVPFDIYIAEGKITKVEALPNTETPSFFKRAYILIDNWLGKTPEEALDMKVDGISGATYSSEAIINNINVGLAYYDGTTNKNHGSMPWKIWVALAMTLAACIVPLFVKKKLYHNILLIVNVAVLGFWCGQFLDYSLILKFFSGNLLFPEGIVAIVMLIGAFIYPLFGRPQHYCTHICPLGSAQQLVGQICGYKLKIPAKVVKGLDWFRKILWAALMLMLWTDCLTSWMDLELFQAFQFESASWWIIGAAALFVALSAVVSRPYCRFVCPTGSLFKRSENIG